MSTTFEDKQFIQICQAAIIDINNYVNPKSMKLALARKDGEGELHRKAVIKEAKGLFDNKVIIPYDNRVKHHNKRPITSKGYL